MPAKRTLPERTCETCGRTFRQKSSTTGKYCSKACWYKAYDKQNERTCQVCGKTFSGKGDQKACSQECADVLRRTAKRHTHCENCGKPLAANVHPRVRFCSKSCGAQGRNNKGNVPLPIGTRRPHASGYVVVKVGPNKADWMLEHRHVMEQTLGRTLAKHERVHHKDGNRANNDPYNLELWKVKAKDPPGVRAVDYHCSGCLCEFDLTPSEMEAVRDFIRKLQNAS